jgi:hypothetical protein
MGLENNFLCKLLFIGMGTYVREIGEKPAIVDGCALRHNCYIINKFNPSPEYVYILCIILKTISDYFPVDFPFKMDILLYLLYELNYFV